LGTPGGIGFGGMDEVIPIGLWEGAKEVL